MGQDHILDDNEVGVISGCYSAAEVLLELESAGAAGPVCQLAEKLVEMRRAAAQSTGGDRTALMKASWDVYRETLAAVTTYHGWDDWKVRDCVEHLNGCTL